jgi:hypothetical protein
VIKKPALVSVLAGYHVPIGNDLMLTESFDPDAFSVNAIRAYPAVDAAAVIADLEPVSLPGFDEVDILATVDLAQHDIARLKVVRSCRHHGA